MGLQAYSTAADSLRLDAHRPSPAGKPADLPATEAFFSAIVEAADAVGVPVGG